MDPNKLDFHIHSRKPFAEESAVMDAVEQARKQVGQVQGAAMFKGKVHVVAMPTVIPRAVDIIREGMDTAVQKAVSEGYIQKAIAEHFIDKRVLTGTSAAHAAVTASLKRMGFGT
jgi:hypothetical protein